MPDILSQFRRLAQFLHCSGKAVAQDTVLHVIIDAEIVLRPAQQRIILRTEPHGRNLQQAVGNFIDPHAAQTVGDQVHIHVIAISAVHLKGIEQVTDRQMIDAIQVNGLRHAVDIAIFHGQTANSLKMRIAISAIDQLAHIGLDQFSFHRDPTVNLQRKAGGINHMLTVIFEMLIHLIPDINQISLGSRIVFLTEKQTQRRIARGFRYLIKFADGGRAEDHALHGISVEHAEDSRFLSGAGVIHAHGRTIALKEFFLPERIHLLGRAENPQIDDIRHLMVVCRAVNPLPVQLFTVHRKQMVLSHDAADDIDDQSSLVKTAIHFLPRFCDTVLPDAALLCTLIMADNIQTSHVWTAD